MNKVDKALQKRIGELIRATIEHANLPQKDVAAQLEIQRVTITSWEMGTSMPHITQLPKLASILQVPIKYFFDEEEATRND